MLPRQFMLDTRLVLYFENEIFVWLLCKPLHTLPTHLLHLLTPFPSFVTLAPIGLFDHLYLLTKSVNSITQVTDVSIKTIYSSVASTCQQYN